MREYKDMYMYEQYMALTSLQKENSRGTQGAWKDGASDGLLEIHATAAPLRSATGRFTLSKLQDLDMRIQRSQNSPGEWWCESQVASMGKHMSINKSGS